MSPYECVVKTKTQRGVNLISWLLTSRSMSWLDHYIALSGLNLPQVNLVKNKSVLHTSSSSCIFYWIKVQDTLLRETKLDSSIWDLDFRIESSFRIHKRFWSMKWWYCVFTEQWQEFGVREPSWQRSIASWHRHRHQAALNPPAGSRRPRGSAEEQRGKRYCQTQLHF